jgi:hypothetical protein
MLETPPRPRSANCTQRHKENETEQAGSESFFWGSFVWVKRPRPFQFPPSYPTPAHKKIFDRIRNRPRRRRRVQFCTSTCTVSAAHKLQRRVAGPRRARARGALSLWSGACMAGLQRSSETFRRPGSSGLVWDDKNFSGEIKPAVAPEDGGGTAHSRSAGHRHAGYKATGREPPALAPPSPRVAVCGFCRIFRGGGKAKGRGRGGDSAKVKGRLH